MQRCPHCGTEVNVRELPHQGFFKSYRCCAKCGGKFTADTDTKYRQALFIVIALISLAFTIFLYFGDMGWLIPAISSYLALGLLIYWGNKKLFFVPYIKDQNKKDNT